MGFVIGFGVGLAIGVVVMALASVSAQRREWASGYAAAKKIALKECMDCVAIEQIIKEKYGN